MKKLTTKIKSFRKPASTEERPSRITNETVAEHREQILAGGRKFKYPVQYQRHKLVLNTIIIGVATVVVLSIIVWWQLYPAQNTSKFMYRLTQLVPLQVAKVDGEGVRYSEYLKKYRSSIHFLQQQNSLNQKTADGKRQMLYIKQREMESVQRDTLAHKLAKQNKVTVSSKEVDAFIQRDLDAKKVSLAAFEKTVLNSFYDWSLDDYKGVVRNELLKRKVEFKLDADAKAKSTAILTQLQQGANFEELAKTQSEDEATKAAGGDSTTLPLDNQDPNGLIAAAKELQPGTVSKVIEGTDAYYIVKLTEKNDSTIRYSLIKVSLDEFDKRFEAVKKAGKIKEYIDIKEEK